MTTEARSYLQAMLRNAGAQEGQTLRLVHRETGLGFAIDEPRRDDLTYAHDGKVVLVVAQDLDNAMGDKSLSVKAAEGGPALVLE